jgi:hypothetical protein
VLQHAVDTCTQPERLHAAQPYIAFVRERCARAAHSNAATTNLQVLSGCRRFHHQLVRQAVLRAKCRTAEEKTSYKTQREAAWQKDVVVRNGEERRTHLSPLNSNAPKAVINPRQSLCSPPAQNNIKRRTKTSRHQASCSQAKQAMPAQHLRPNTA